MAHAQAKAIATARRRSHGPRIKGGGYGVNRKSEKHLNASTNNPREFYVTDTAIESEIQAKGLTARGGHRRPTSRPTSASYAFTALVSARARACRGMDELKLLTIAVLVLKKRLYRHGEYGLRSPENFDADTRREDRHR